jgi:glycosyltransferase involved in cell wall biosynthesis
MPPAPTGVADYSAALLPYLRALGEVEVDATQADAALYHIGNNHLHREIYARALANPGVAVLHDAVLQHFFLGTLEEAAYIDEFVYNYGEWSRGLAAELWRNRARSGADPRYFAHPMLRRIAAAAPAVIVHNPAAAHLVREHAPGACIHEIPHLFVRPNLPREDETRRLRTSLGLSAETLLAGVFGHQRETKRLAPVLRAFHRAVRAGAEARLLIAGNFVSPTYEASLTPLLEGPHVLRTGYLPEAEFWRYAAATDLFINLRFPSAGETSGVAVSMMGIGKPVVFTAGEELARIPEHACLRVEHGPAEEDALAECIRWLAGNRVIAAEIGRRAAAHIAREHAPEKVASQYWDALRTL